MGGEYDSYLSKYYCQNTAILDRNAALAFSHHGIHFPRDMEAAILEIGPGTGTMIRFLSQQCGYKNVRAVDLSTEAVAACNEIVPGSTELVSDASAFLRAHVATFDLVIMLHTLEHIPKDEILPLARSVYLSLKPGGKFVVEVPNCMHPLVGVGNRYVDFTHTIGFTNLSLRFVFENAGFSDVAVYPCKVPRESVLRCVQRLAQDTVELGLRALLRVYWPTAHVILAGILGACGTKSPTTD